MRRLVLHLLVGCTLLAWQPARASAQSPIIPSPDLEVTPEIHRAAQRGLAFLARTQTDEGCWPDSYGQLSGVTGLAILAFMAHGEMPDEGRYGHVIRKAVDYIVSTQQPNGLLVGRRGGSIMYSHGFATLALAEVYGQIDDARVGPALEKAAQLIIKSQNSLGGWRYNVNSSDADTTVSGAQMIALRAAANAGVEVPIETIRHGVRFYKNCFCPGGGFGYTNNSGPNLPRAGVGLLVLSLCGEYRSDEARATADYMLANLGQSQGSYFHYMIYYGSQAMFQAGGRYWRTWNQTMTPALIAMQQEDGSWPDSGSGGVTCVTAFALLGMQINYNYLPIYQR